MIMKLRLSDRARTKLAEKYLDLAERYPNFNWGPVRSFRRIRESQRRRAENAFQRSRAPEGAELSFLYFRLIEVFHLEDFGQLYSGLVRLLPGLVDHPIYESFSSDFAHRSQSLEGTSWEKVGYLTRDDAPVLATLDAHRKIPGLPEEVRSVAVEVYKVLPSIYAVTFDVYLNGTATERLNQLHDKRYLPAIRFHRTIPLKRLGGKVLLGGRSESNPNEAMEREILDWSDKLRSGVERCIRPYLRGYFSRQSAGGVARLPAVEVFALSGTPAEQEAFDRWASEARSWLNAFGLSRINRARRSGGIIFSEPREREGGQWPQRLVVLREESLRSIDLDEYEGDESSAIMEHTGESLDALTPAIVLKQYLAAIERQVEKLRTAALGSMRSSRGLNKYIGQGNRIHQESHLLDRLSMEFTQERPLLEHTTDGTDAEQRSIELRIEFLRRQLTYVSSTFSEYLALRNMTANYRLQWYVLVLSVIATVASVISVIVSWPNIKEFISDVFGITL